MVVVTDYVAKKIIVVYNTFRYKEFEKNYGTNFIVFEFDLSKNKILRYNESSILSDEKDKHKCQV